MATNGSLEARDLKPLEANKFQPIELSTVNRKQNYYIALQFGSMARWRKYSGRPRKVQATATPGKVDRIHDPKVVYVEEPLSGKEVQGLIQSHNDWIELNRMKNHDDWRGHVDRQIMVLAFEPTTDLPPELKNKKVDGDFLVGIVNALVQKQLDERSVKPVGKT